MFEKLLTQIKEPTAEIIAQQTAIPADKKSVATDDAIASISEEIDRMMDSGDFSTLAGIKDADNPNNNATIQNVVVSFAEKLQKNSQLDAVTAQNTSASVVPTLVVTMKEKFSGGGIDIKSLMSSLSLSDMMKLMANMGKLKEAFK
ncbi:MAG: hypothetical protein QM610_13420 [Chitinophagaceae bacterium]